LGEILETILRLRPLDAIAGCPDWLEAACVAMREEANLRVGLERLRELALVSDGYLARTMHRYYGTTPIEYVTRLRLERSAVLLTTTQASIREIAQRTGFASQSYFGRCFKEAYEISPRAYRNQDRRAALS
jgi:AraC family transcriptional regulator, dual regulator of chb operon